MSPPAFALRGAPPKAQGPPVISPSGPRLPPGLPAALRTPSASTVRQGCLLRMRRKIRSYPDCPAGRRRFPAAPQAPCGARLVTMNHMQGRGIRHGGILPRRRGLRRNIRPRRGMPLPKGKFRQSLRQPGISAAGSIRRNGSMTLHQALTSAAAGRPASRAGRS
jgi:hypothetical protein